MAYLFTPDQWTNTTVLHGRSLQYSYKVSKTAWKDAANVWHQDQTPASEDLVAAKVFYTSPAVVDNTTAAELIAAGIGTCTLIT